MMICVYVDGTPAPLTAYLQVVAESLLDVVHSLMCPCASIGSLKTPTMARRADSVETARRCA
jgi:hypothetical protein